MPKWRLSGPFGGWPTTSLAQTWPQRSYGARFDFVSGGPGYCGDLFIIYGDALSGQPLLLVREPDYGGLRVHESET